MDKSQGQTHPGQEEFHKYGTKLSSLLIFHHYFQYLIIPKGLNEKHIGTSEGLKGREASGQREWLLTPVQGWVLGWIVCDIGLDSTKHAKFKGIEYGNRRFQVNNHCQFTLWRSQGITGSWRNLRVQRGTREPGAQARLGCLPQLWLKGILQQKPGPRSWARNVHLDSCQDSNFFHQDKFKDLYCWSEEAAILTAVARTGFGTGGG